MGVKSTCEWKCTGVNSAVPILRHITRRLSVCIRLWETRREILPFRIGEIWLRKTLRFMLGNRRERTWQNIGKYLTSNRMTMNNNNKATNANDNIHLVYLGLSKHYQITLSNWY